MYYMKNITANDITLSPLGIVLAGYEYRDVSEFGTRSEIQSYASYLNDMVYTDKIILLNADMIEYSKVECVQIISNGYEVIVIDNITTHPPVERYYFVKGKGEVTSKDRSCHRSFEGSCQTLFILSSEEVNIRLSNGEGLVLSDERLEKRQTLELDFGGRMKDLNIEISRVEKTSTIDIFIDGYSSRETHEIQDFIDNWSM